MVKTRFMTKGRGAGRKVIPMKDRPMAGKVNVKVKIDPKMQLLKNIRKRNVITEQELGLVMGRLNSKAYAVGQVTEMIGDEGLELTPEQSRKGYGYLMNQWKSPKTGMERKNNPFGYIEQEILKDFDRFCLKDTFDAGTINFSHHIPIYKVYSKIYGSFEYHMAGGKVNIIG
ncbi:hypothetical protein GQ472_01690 [archaeon]|nr:hypothetical protein [archaeon]